MMRVLHIKTSLTSQGPQRAPASLITPTAWSPPVSDDKHKTLTDLHCSLCSGKLKTADSTGSLFLAHGRGSWCQ